MAESLLLQRDILQAIQQRKRQKAIELSKSRELLKASYNHVISPLPQAATRAQKISHVVSNALAIWQGVSMGIKIVRGLRYTFKK